jgi:ferredoxin-thioredoxin reductase catalytic chain
MDIFNETTINEWYKRLKKEAEDSGYHFNPDIPFVKMLIEGLLVNNDRYGYPACPCRFASGTKLADLDIICPCDYRDPDLADYGACYCALYVNDEISSGKKQAVSIPERRPLSKSYPQSVAEPFISEPGPKVQFKLEKGLVGDSEENFSDKNEIDINELVKIRGLAYPIWRCKVCGYLCARESPPERCPICKVTKDRFERLL